MRGVRVRAGGQSESACGSFHRCRTPHIDSRLSTLPSKMRARPGFALSAADTTRARLVRRRPAARPANGSSQQHATAPPYSPPEHAACSFAAMRLVLFRSAWGLNLRADAARACASVRAAGFDGIEASLTDIGGSQAERLAFGKAAQAEGLELILSAYSSWVNYEGVCEAKPVWVEELQP